MSEQTWNAEEYGRHARFVSDLGQTVLELLAPKAAERILDVGCGDGVLTQRIAQFGCAVVGVDSSPQFVASARRLGLEVFETDAAVMQFEREFDAVFSNAALHWMKDADAVIARVARALRRGGRFVAEMGGEGCVKTIQTALVEELDRRGHDGQAAVPWYFPSVEDYRSRLSAAGFEVRYIALIPRPTPLPDMMGWLTTFAGSFTARLPPAERAEYLHCVRERLRPLLCDSSGNWIADYVRLRFSAFAQSFGVPAASGD
jgi:trans-aconitate methyltransferase